MTRKKGTEMKKTNTTRNPYQTNRGGLIKAPNKPAEKEPAATVITGKNDLRTGK